MLLHGEPRCLDAIATTPLEERSVWTNLRNDNKTTKHISDLENPSLLDIVIVGAMASPSHWDPAPRKLEACSVSHMAIGWCAGAKATTSARYKGLMMSMRDAHAGREEVATAGAEGAPPTAAMAEEVPRTPRSSRSPWCSSPRCRRNHSCRRKPRFYRQVS